MVPQFLEHWILERHRKAPKKHRPDELVVFESSDLDRTNTGTTRRTLVRAFISDGNFLVLQDEMPMVEPFSFPTMTFRWDPSQNFAIVEEQWDWRWGSGWALQFDDAGNVVDLERLWIS